MEIDDGLVVLRIALHPRRLEMDPVEGDIIVYDDELLELIYAIGILDVIAEERASGWDIGRGYYPAVAVEGPAPVAEVLLVDPGGQDRVDEMEFQGAAAHQERVHALGVGIPGDLDQDLV